MRENLFTVTIASIDERTSSRRRFHKVLDKRVSKVTSLHTGQLADLGIVVGALDISISVAALPSKTLRHDSSSVALMNNDWEIFLIDASQTSSPPKSTNHEFTSKISKTVATQCAVWLWFNHLSNHQTKTLPDL